MKKKYWIERIVPSGEVDPEKPDLDKEERDMHTAYISCSGHGLCIQVHGTNTDCTERAIGIIKGLNDE